MCNKNEIEDELHCLLVYSANNVIRIELIKEICKYIQELKQCSTDNPQVLERRNIVITLPVPEQREDGATHVICFNN